MSGTVVLSLAAAVMFGAGASVAPPPPRGRLDRGDPVPRGAFTLLLRRGPNPKIPRDGPGVRHRIASDIELFAACYRAGLPAATAAEAVAASYGGVQPGQGTTADMWRRVVSYLSLGVEPDRAWAVMDGTPGLEELASLVTLSHASGTAVAQGCDRIVTELRDAAADDATAAAERAGVLISIPLAAFFLPAFFVLGLAPVVIGLGAGVLGG